MGRRTFHTHALARIDQRPFDVYAVDGYTRTGEKALENVKIALCGHEVRAAWDRDRDFDTNPNNITCPTCNKKLAQAAIKARPDGAGRLEIIADKAARGGFRHAGGSKVVLEGEVIGYVGFEDHAWRIYPLMIERWDDKAEAGGPYVRNAPRPMDKDGSISSLDRSYRPPPSVPRYRSKEAAALACEQAYLQGLLKTGAQLHQEAAEYAKAAQESADRRSALVAERLAEKSQTLNALDEILNTKTLSNFQRQGLMNAIALVERHKVTAYETD